MGYSPWGHKELDTTEATQHTCITTFLTSWRLNPGVLRVPNFSALYLQSLNFPLILGAHYIHCVWIFTSLNHRFVSFSLKFVGSP